MIKLGQHIQYLLTSHDCVIVPGWGAFIVNYDAARFTSDGVICAPSKTITFNPALLHNDGMLAGSLIRSYGYSYDLACQKIEDEVDTMKHVLAVNREVSIDGIGLFKVVDGGTPSFEPVSGNIVTARYTHLPSFSVSRVLDIAKTETATTEETENIPSVSRFKQTALRAVASIAVLVCIASALMLPIGPEHQSLVSMASMGVSNIEHEEPDVEEIVCQEIPDGKLFVMIPGKDSSSKVDTVSRKRYRQIVEYKALMAERREARRKARAEKIALANSNQQTLEASKNGVERAIETQSKTLSIKESDSYCLVVSSHTSRAEAERYIASHSSHTMKILEMDGRYRVYIATGSTSKQARKAISSPGFKKRYPGAWVCRKAQ